MGCHCVDRLVDMIARRPSGPVGRFLYGRPVGHMAGFRLVLEKLPATADDTVLEVGCGAGVFLDMLLRSGCRARAVDHSGDMVAEALRRNAAAVAEGRLDVVEGDAAALPHGDGAFAKVFCLNAFFFFPQPQAALAEMARVLAPGGALAILTASPQTARWARWVFGPVASRMRFDAPEQLAAWSTECGLLPEETAEASGSGFLFLARKPVRLLSPCGKDASCQP
jgi:SAM-dependent methyltransferase